MATDNQGITFKGNKITVLGNCIKAGTPAPDFKLTGTDMQDLSLSDFAGKTLVLSVIPSIDTPVCQVQTKRFNEDASKLGEDVEILTVSMDLPFAQKRWCGAEGIEQVQTASDYKYRSFGENYGTHLQELGLLARAVFVIDKQGIVQYVEYVPEVTEEPNYEAALTKINELS